MWLTVGMFPEPVRVKLGYRWTRTDQVAFRIFGTLLSAAWRFVPFERRYHPRARAGWRRVRAGLTDAPLVETPARNLASPAERARPLRYPPTV